MHITTYIHRNREGRKRNPPATGSFPWEGISSHLNLTDSPPLRCTQTHAVQEDHTLLCLYGSQARGSPSRATPRNAAVKLLPPCFLSFTSNGLAPTRGALDLYLIPVLSSSSTSLAGHWIPCLAAVASKGFPVSLKAVPLPARPSAHPRPP